MKENWSERLKDENSAEQGIFGGSQRKAEHVKKEGKRERVGAKREQRTDPCVSW